MADETYGFSQARVRLEEIVSAVRKKDTSLEKSLDLLEEGVRLANQCTELIDHADWEAAGTGQPIVADAEPAHAGIAGDAGEHAVEASSVDAIDPADGAADQDADEPHSGPGADDESDDEPAGMAGDDPDDPADDDRA